jgi:integrase
MAKISGLVKRGNIYWFRNMVAGKRTSVSLGTGVLEDAIKAIKKYRANPHAPKSGTVAALQDAFLADKTRENRYTESTKRAAQISLKLLGDFAAGVPVTAISTRTIQRWFDAKRNESSEATAQAHLYRTRSFFKWCTKKKLLVTNPCDGVAMGRVSRRGRLRFCTAAERDLLINSVTPSDHDLAVVLWLGFYCGLRRGEICEARKDWIDRTSGMFHVRRTESFRPKDREERAIPIANQFSDFLETFSVLSEYLIAGGKTLRGRSLYRYDFRKPFETHVKKCGLPWVTPHVMRHTFASLLASSGVSIYKIALWLGDDVRVVQRHYAKLLPGDRDIDRM